MKPSRHSKKRVITTWIIASTISLAMVISIFFTRPIYNWAALSDATFIPSALLLGISALVWISRSGTFDTAAYSFVAIGARFKPREVRRYKDAYDYKVQADERRAKSGGYILPFLSWGGLLLIIAVISSILSMN